MANTTLGALSEFTMRVLVVDTNNLVAAAAYVFNEAKTAEGFPTGGLFGSLSMLKNFISAEPHDAIVCAIDWGVPAFRRQICPEYKAQRAVFKTKEDEDQYKRYKLQVEVVHEVLTPLGIQTARGDGWEGDDVIAALALNWLDEHKITIYSSDKDFIHIADSRIRLYNPRAKQSEVPWRDPDPMYCLKRCLDPKEADNLDGVPGIGKVKADKLVESFVSDMRILGKKLDHSNLTAPFLAWASARSAEVDAVGKLCAKVMTEQQKVRANWQCTYLPRTVDECAKAMRFRRKEPDRAAFEAVCKKYNLQPIIEEMDLYWKIFSRLNRAIE